MKLTITLPKVGRATMPKISMPKLPKGGGKVSLPKITVFHISGAPKTGLKSLL